MEKRIYLELKKRIDWLESWHRKPRFDDLVEDRIRRLIDHNGIKLTRRADLTKPPVLRLFRNKQYVYKHDSHSWWGFMADFDGRGEADCSVVFMKQVATSMGMIFYTKAYENIDGKEKLRYTVYTRHFFERMQQRLGLKTVEAAVKEFMREHVILIWEEKGLAGDEQPGYKGSIFIPFLNGGALGERFNDVILLKTFISNEQMDEWQTDRAMQIRSQPKPHYFRKPNILSNLFS